MLAHGGYLPLGVPLLKPVAALPGQRVCRIGAAVTVDGKPLGDALARDHRGRPLPVWQGCRHVLPGQVFVMNAAVPKNQPKRVMIPPSGAARPDGGRACRDVVPARRASDCADVANVPARHRRDQCR